MKKIFYIFTIAVLVVVSAQISYGQTKEEQQQLLIKAAKFLEIKPFDKDAKDVRGWAVRYVIETDDVTVVICTGNFMDAALEKKNKYGSELLAQYTIGMAAFKLENPSKKDDENAAQLAGIESMLRAYETMVKEKPKAKFAGMDDLLAKRDKDELKALVEAANCGKKDKK
jgi:hypothetical protein